MGKRVDCYIKLQVKAGGAQPSPPVGPALGSRGVNIMEFCKAFNAQTQGTDAAKDGIKLPVIITVYNDKSFTFVIKTAPATALLKKAAEIKTGSANPNLNKVGKVTRSQLRAIAESKAPDLTGRDIEAMMKSIAGSARSMGLEVEEE